MFDQQLYEKNGKLAVKTVKAIPDVDQTFGGTFSAVHPGAGPQRARVREARPPVGRQGQTVKVVGG